MQETIYMTKYECIENYIDFIITNLRKVEGDAFIDYIWNAYHTYFWSPGRSIGIVVENEFLNDVKKMCGDPKEFSDDFLFKLIRERIKIYGTGNIQLY